MRALKITGAVLAAVIVVIALLLVVGVPSGFLSAAIQNRVERETGYRLTIAGTTRIGLWPSLNVSLSDVTLEDPKDSEGSRRITIGKLQADMTLSSAWSGHPRITQLTVTDPVVHLPLLRERTRAIAAPAKPAAPANGKNAVTIDRVSIVNGTMVFANKRDRVENRIDRIEADAVFGAGRKINIHGSARAGEHPLKFAIAATAPASPIAQQSVPVDLTIDAPDLLHAPLSAKADVRFNGSLVTFNGVSGKLGDGSFTGWASVEAGSKPLVKVDLDFQQINIPLSKSAESPGPRPWSNAPIDLLGLNYVDANVTVSAADATIGDVHFAPAEVKAMLAGGVLKATVSNLGAYGGQASGELIVDASSGSPTFAMHCDLAGVNAQPLLTSLAGFDKIKGKLQAKVAARSLGASQSAIMSNLNGTVFADFRDGSIEGINVAQMIHSLTASPLSGWQEQQDQSTGLSELSASFQIDRGQATTSDLNLVGPLVRVTGAGTVNIAGKSLALRVEPTLVLTTEGQGRTSNPVGFGIPVVIDGPWAAPRIYPDMAGILDNPDAAYAKLRQMGKGLFGPNGGLNGLLNGLGGSPGNGTNSGGQPGGGDAQSSPPGLGQTLGNLIQQGLSGRRSPSASPAPQPQAAPQQSTTPPAAQDSRPMDDVLRHLFSQSPAN
jgi:AsmA protein